MRICIILLFVLLSCEPVSAICCPYPLGSGHHLCKDGTWTWSCCGNQSAKRTFTHLLYGCNIFCCNCTGGCRKGTYTQCIASCDVRYESCTWGCTEAAETPWCLQACEKSKNECYIECEESE